MRKQRITRALISVSDKTGLTQLGAALAAADVEIVSTGGSARQLAEAGIAVTPVEAVTGFAECLGGRVKTLHPHVHAGILADLDQAEHREQLDGLGIAPFDLVVVNLYPFTATVASGAGFDECVEHIDIGGPALLRAAAKNHAHVAAISDPAQYELVTQAVAAGGFTGEQRRELAAHAFRHVADYDVAVATWLSGPDDALPGWVGITAHQVQPLRYGENSHQMAALYRGDGQGITAGRLLQGKAMSFNNYLDGEAAYRAAYDFTEPCVAIIKHANPCGIAVAGDIAEAHAKAHACDPLSAFGGVVAANRPVTARLASAIVDIFTEVIIAPGFEADALEILSHKPNLRLVEVGPYPAREWEMRSISGGLVIQTTDRLGAPGDSPDAWTLAAGPAASVQQLADLEFAWRACRCVKSNAIVLAADKASVGVGMGQVNRVDSCRLAVNRAGERAQGAIAASDAFFPFADGPEILADAGVGAIVQPGGSVRDHETIELCEQRGISLYLTGVRHFFH